MYKIMTPGPTQVAENVRLARSRECTNPDLDASFVEFYKETCEEISRLLHTDNETLILGGEGILGLEAACASMTEPGDRVLVLDNGIYGKGFADFVSMYGGRPELYTRDYQNTLDVKELEAFLAQALRELGLDLRHRLVGVEFGVATLFEASDVVGDLLVVLGHLRDRRLPRVGARRQVAERHRDVQHLLDALRAALRRRAEQSAFLRHMNLTRRVALVPPGLDVAPLGAALAIPTKLRQFDWLKRRKECGSPCQLCAKECEIQAIHPDGRINANECHYCLDCQMTYHNERKCLPLVMKNKQAKRGGQGQVGIERIPVTSIET